LESSWNVHMNSIIRRVRTLLGVEEESTQYELQSPKKPGEYGDNKYERFKEYIADLRRITLERLFLPLIMLFYEKDILDSEKNSSIRDRRFRISLETGLDSFTYNQKNREIYTEIYRKITPLLLTILVDWFHSIAFSPDQEQTGQTDNRNSILKQIIDIINSSNSDKRRELVLELLEAIGFSSDQSIKEAARLNKKPQEEPQESELFKLLSIDPKLLQAQEITLKYIILILEGIFNFKLPSEQYLLDFIFQEKLNPPDTSLNEIKGLLKLILLWNRWCRLKPDTEKLPTIKEKIRSKKVLDSDDIDILVEIITDANPDLFLLKPESKGDSTPESEGESLLRNLIEIIVTNSFGEIYQEAQELHPQGILVIFEDKLQKLKNLKNEQETGSWLKKLENLLDSVTQSGFSYRKQINKNPEIASRYANIYYEIWLLIIEFKHLEIKSKLPEIQISCNALESYLVAIQERAKIINGVENLVIQQLTKIIKIINFINEHLTSLYTLFDSSRAVRTVFLDFLKFLKNPDIVKQKLQEITDSLDQISGLLGRILEILKIIKTINSGGSNLGTNIEGEIEGKIEKLNSQIAELKNIIAVTISDISDESPAAYIAAYASVTPAYTGETQKLPVLPNGANPNWLRAELSRLRAELSRLKEKFKKPTN
jgi:hypothetical protein